MLTATAAFLSYASCGAQFKNEATTTVKVYGNCGMCESSIEKAASKKKISKADWNEASKMAIISYDSTKTNVDAILKNIALAGYDNEKFLAPDAAYDKLPGCCKYAREKKTAAAKQPAKDSVAAIHNPTHHQHDAPAGSLQETSQLTKVFDSYFSLKDALVKTDGNAASVKAQGLLTAIQAVKMEKLPMEVHTVWMKILNDVKQETEHISAAKEIAQQRTNFMNLSKNMHALLKAAKPAEAVYYQFCPMANDGKGAHWLSKESNIKNPYYGSQMLTCGSTVETIKQ